MSTGALVAGVEARSLGNAATENLHLHVALNVSVSAVGRSTVHRPTKQSFTHNGGLCIDDRNRTLVNSGQIRNLNVSLEAGDSHNFATKTNCVIFRKTIDEEGITVGSDWSISQSSSTLIVERNSLSEPSLILDFASAIANLVERAGRKLEQVGVELTGSQADFHGRLAGDLSNRED